jgi:hypothetical protein
MGELEETLSTIALRDDRFIRSLGDLETTELDRNTRALARLAALIGLRGEMLFIDTFGRPLSPRVRMPRATTCAAPCAQTGYRSSRAMHLKPMWLVEVSIASGWRAAGR